MQCGEVYLLNELAQIQSPWRKCVRVGGFVEGVDLQKKQCMLHHRGHRIRIDLSLVDLTTTKPDSQCQVIGEIRQYCAKVVRRNLFSALLLRLSVTFSFLLVYFSLGGRFSGWRNPGNVYTCFSSAKR